MLTIYTLVATDGVVSGTPHIGVVTTSELSDLKALLTTKLNFQIDTRYFAAKIANGDPANARYHGAALGNLSAGASGAHLNKLVDKWFQGGDLPAIRATDSAQYGHVTGSLFQNGISYTDVDQGVADDCYFLAALGEVAQHSPATIYKMFTDNGDSTYSVRFFKNGASVFVTVNQDLPIDANNMAVYAGWGGAQSYSSTNELWVALAEKAYAQLNESGGINQDGTNTYAGIGYGWPANAFKQIVGKSASDQTFTSSISLVNAATAGRAITLLSKTSGVANNIVPNHAYMLIGYNAQTKRFLLYNPWGTTNTLSDGHDRPTILNLTFAQLQNNFTNWTSLLI
jgi:hypothetical protein